jgi:hypothetical protein
MSLDTYANLKQEIIDHLERDDLDSYVDTFIDVAEARHKREIRVKEMLVMEPLGVDTRTVDLPNNTLEIKTIRLLTNPVTVLTYLNIDQMNRQRQESGGKPEFYTVHSQIEFDRSPDSAYNGEVLFYKSQTALDSSNTSNDILANAPDAYLYAALVASAPFLMNDERIATWEVLYQQARDELNRMARHRPGPLMSRVIGATP